jgi:hypothetical protein
MLSHDIKLQFLPGHHGIDGSETADHAASEAHLLWYCTVAPIYEEEMIRPLQHTALGLWQEMWLRNVHEMGKGLFSLK